MGMAAGGVSKTKVATVIVAADGSGDTTDIQTGLDLLPAGGGVVYVKEGTYTIAATINMTKSNTGLKGAGRSTILNIPDGDGIAIGDIINVLIEDFAITGTSIASAIEASTGTPKQVTIRGCYFYDLDAHGLDLRVGHFLINGNFFSNVGDSVASRYAVALGTSRSVITGNIFDSCPHISIVTSALADETVISNNVVVGSGNVGIQSSGTDCIIANNFVTTSTLSGINVVNGDGTTIIGNVCKNNVQNGIQVFTSDNCVVTGNVCTGNDSANSAGYDGIQVYFNCDNCIVANNRCAENDRYEINIRDNTCDKTLVHGNHCIGTDHEAAINDAGTDTIDANNVIA